MDDVPLDAHAAAPRTTPPINIHNKSLRIAFPP
jgi:hypothetical protein